jgi:hypothetical protein
MIAFAKGITTSEFWIVALTGLFNIASGLGIHFPSQNEASSIVSTIATSLVALAYAWFRTHLKQNTPIGVSPTVFAGSAPTISTTNATTVQTEVKPSDLT